MTSWTDLIDIDPMEAAKLWEENEKPPDDIPDIVRGTARTRWETELKTARLISNLAVLCEELSIYHIRPGSRENEEAKAFRLRVMRRMFNSDGSRRFPEVK